MAGAESTAAVSTSKPLSSFERVAAKLAASPRESAFTVLASVALVLTIALAATFFIRIQVQPVDLLLGGAVVASFALVLIGANAKLLLPLSISEQAASVVYAPSLLSGFEEVSVTESSVNIVTATSTTRPELAR